MQGLDKYPFDRPFRLKILSLCLDKMWMSRFGLSIIEPEYFEQEDEEVVCRALLDFYHQYGNVPADPEDIIVTVGPEYAEFVYELYQTDVDTRLASDKCIVWAREQAAKLAILESVDDVKSGKIEQVIERMKHVLEVGKDLILPGIDVIEDTDKWLFDLWSDKVPTPWTHVNKILEGGLASGELGIILAPPNRGKSMSLINLGYGAAGIGSAKKVVHFTHEMGQGVVSKRYASRIMFRFPKREEDLDKYEDDLIEMAMKLMPGHIRVVHCNRPTVEELDVRLERLLAEGYKFDMIIDDYPDLIKPSKHFNDKRFELSDIYTDLRALGDKYGVPIWGASQANRASLSKEVITMQDIAEDIGKAAIADVIIALCQTRDEHDMETCRLYMAKVRDGESQTMLDAKFYSKQQAIITTGVTISKKEKEEEDSDV